jgi:MFS family permease
MGLAFSLSVTPVFIIRVLLGLFESVFGPVLTAITVQWYLKEEQPVIQAIWQSMFGVASLVSSLLA